MRSDIKIFVACCVALIAVVIIGSILIPSIDSSRVKQVERKLKKKMDLEVKNLGDVINKNCDKGVWHCETKNYNIKYPKDIIGWLFLKIQAHQEICCKWIHNNKLLQEKSYTLIYSYEDKEWILYRRQ